MKKINILNFGVALAVIVSTINYTSIYSLAGGIYARHEQSPAQAMHAFDEKPEGLGWYDSMKWNEAHDMYCYLDSDSYICVGNGNDLEAGDFAFVYYATPGEPTWESGRNILLEEIKKGTMPVYDKGLMVDPNHRTAKASVDPNYVPQSEYTNQIVLENVVSEMNKQTKYVYEARYDAYSCSYRKIEQSIPCFEITASKPCLIEIQQNTVRTDGEIFLPNTLLFCPTDLNQCISVHSEFKYAAAHVKGVDKWVLNICTSDFYNNAPIDYSQIWFSLDSPEETAAGMAKLGQATTHFMLAEGKNYIYYNSYCDTINNFIISTDDGSASIKLDCVTRYASQTTF